MKLWVLFLFVGFAFLLVNADSDMEDRGEGHRAQRFYGSTARSYGGYDGRGSRRATASEDQFDVLKH
ncbi:hypothetical protein lerEdw1_006590 [Lerista edwardsae]|nr:hypothetical protein lerEdw1_006590 [Lerista edwardsae]